jgi:hypothetical protein
MLLEEKASLPLEEPLLGPLGATAADGVTVLVWLTPPSSMRRLLSEGSAAPDAAADIDGVPLSAG